MEIVVLIKPVPEPETKLRATPDGTAFDGEGVKWVLAGYDESAVEQALLLKESAAGSKVRAITAGPAPRCEEVLRAALALGCDTASWVETPKGVELDPLTAAQLLAGAVERYPHDLVLVGKQSSDDESGLVGPALGGRLKVPDFGCVSELRVDPTSNGLTFQRAVDGGSESLRSSLPCVVELQQAWNDPRTAKLPSILKSRKMPIEKVEAPSPQPASRVRAAGFRLPPPRTGARLLEYKSPEEAAETLVRILKEEAKVFP
ncbi:MAG: electron transfer flavoprotein subunit beta/FixA family protein [Thermoplasmata archaeon]|nr:electron transfer flavoprotein subunit beta/FixA family protein [Thermoplasmata archaeon]